MLQHLQAQKTTATRILGETHNFLLCALSLLFVETAVLRDTSPYCTHICQGAELSLFTIKSLFKHVTKVAARQKSWLSQQDVKLALLNRLFPETSLEICNRENNWNNLPAKTPYHLQQYLPLILQNIEKWWQAQLCHSKLEEMIYGEFKWPVESSSLVSLNKAYSWFVTQ